MTEIQKADLVYLDEIPELPDDESLVAAVEFHTIQMGNPNTIEINGVLADKNKFCCEMFTEQNIPHFYFIPLYLNAAYRVAYIGEYSSASSGPPDCLSHNGITPVVPLNYNGKTITNCATCSLFGYGSKFACHNKPSLLGLAWFPAENKLIPFRKDLPGYSSKNGSRLAQMLSMPLKVGDQVKTLPMWTRIVRCSVGLADNKAKGGKVSVWQFDLLDENSNYPDMPYNFVPQDLLGDASKFYGMAKTWKQQTGAALTTPALTSAAPAAQLTGAVQPTQPVAEPVPEAIVVGSEEESDY